MVPQTRWRQFVDFLKTGIAVLLPDWLVSECLFVALHRAQSWLPEDQYAAELPFQDLLDYWSRGTNKEFGARE